MINLIQLQQDVFALLMSCPALRTVNIVLERKFRVDQSVQLDAIWQTVRNDRSGNGILIEEPTFKVKSNNVTGAPSDVIIPVVSFQNGDAAFTPSGGAGFYDTNLGREVMNVLHLQAIAGIGTLTATGGEPAREYEFINAWRVNFAISGVRDQQDARCAVVTVSIDTGLATLASTTSGASIYYTLDGSSPCDPALVDPVYSLPVNSAAVLYTVPFAVTSGQTLRAVAQKTGFNPSEIIKQAIA